MKKSKNITIQISEQSFDRLSDTAKEYSTEPEILIAAAIQKLLDDIEFIRDLRSDKSNKL